jgi:hypothetical protein
VPDPTLCTACPHPRHEGQRCTVHMRSGRPVCDCPGPSESPRIIDCLHMSITRELGDPTKREPGDWVCDDCEAHLHCWTITAQDPGDQGKPAASESAERPDGWYFVKLAQERNKVRRAWTIAVWRSGTWMTPGPNSYELKNVAIVGPRIPIPDEQPCPVTAQELREIAIAAYHGHITTKEYNKLRTLSAYLERKGS